MSEKKRRNSDRRAICNLMRSIDPSEEVSATGVSVMALTERVHSDVAIPTGRKCFLLMYSSEPS
jgi:hypothetical protein